MLVNGIVALSPVSYVAGLVDYDYLREPWFYQRTAFGGLRFDYPDPRLASACYLTIGFLLAFCRYRLGRRPAESQPSPTEGFC